MLDKYENSRGGRRIKAGCLRCCRSCPTNTPHTGGCTITRTSPRSLLLTARFSPRAASATTYSRAKGWRMPTRKDPVCVQRTETPERYQGRFYDAPRSFTVLMRDDASAWIKKRLLAGGVQR